MKKFTILALFVVACLPPNAPKDTADCDKACGRMRALHCEEGEPLDDGTSCTKFCEDTQKSGHALRPSCLVNIETCSEIDLCQDSTDLN